MVGARCCGFRCAVWRNQFRKCPKKFAISPGTPKSFFCETEIYNGPVFVLGDLTACPLCVERIRQTGRSRWGLLPDHGHATTRKIGLPTHRKSGYFLSRSMFMCVVFQPSHCPQ